MSYLGRVKNSSVIISIYILSKSKLQQRKQPCATDIVILIDICQGRNKENCIALDFRQYQQFINVHKFILKIY